MKKTKRLLAFAIALIMALSVSLVFVACGGDDTPPAVTVSSIAVTTPPTTTAYTVGQTFDPAGMVVTATMSDNTTANVTADTIFAPAGALALGDTVITITHTPSGRTTTQAITVADESTPAERFVWSGLTDLITEYFYGDVFGPADVVRGVTVTDANEEIVVGEYGYQILANLVSYTSALDEYGIIEVGEYVITLRLADEDGETVTVGGTPVTATRRIIVTDILPQYVVELGVPSVNPGPWGTGANMTGIPAGEAAIINRLVGTTGRFMSVHQNNFIDVATLSEDADPSGLDGYTFVDHRDDGVYSFRFPAFVRNALSIRLFHNSGNQTRLVTQLGGSGMLAMVCQRGIVQVAIEGMNPRAIISANNPVRVGGLGAVPVTFNDGENSFTIDNATGDIGINIPILPGWTMIYASNADINTGVFANISNGDANSTSFIRDNFVNSFGRVARIFLNDGTSEPLANSGMVQSYAEGTLITNYSQGSPFRRDTAAMTVFVGATVNEAFINANIFTGMTFERTPQTFGIATSFVPQASDFEILTDISSGIDTSSAGSHPIEIKLNYATDSYIIFTRNISVVAPTTYITFGTNPAQYFVPVANTNPIIFNEGSAAGTGQIGIFSYEWWTGGNAMSNDRTIPANFGAAMIIEADGSLVMFVMTAALSGLQNLYTAEHPTGTDYRDPVTGVGLVYNDMRQLIVEGFDDLVTPGRYVILIQQNAGGNNVRDWAVNNLRASLNAQGGFAAASIRVAVPNVVTIPSS
ncbi:MAG: hypothetical protein FWC80_00755 [Firmicutes bacterium]|nr:hypothetical protein [Bacillota bacterium]